MNEKGFFTLMGICFLLIAAILVKGVQESEKNYSYVTTNFQAEVELQNVADSALIEAVNMIKSNEFELEKSSLNFANRSVNQHEIFDRNVDDINVKVFYEYGVFKDNGKGNIYLMKRNYLANNVVEDVYIDSTPKKGVILISVASRDSNILDKKIYRRALAYILTDEDENGNIKFIDNGKIYFMNSLND